MIDASNLPSRDAPDIRTRGPLEILGLADGFDKASIPRIPSFWARLSGRWDDLSSAEPGVSYGASYDQTDTGFRYIAGVPVDPGTPAPDGMERFLAPAGRYAVWIHEGPVAELHMTMRAIFETGLKDAALAFRLAPELERYDESFDPKTGSGRVELWIPVA